MREALYTVEAGGMRLWRPLLLVAVVLSLAGTVVIALTGDTTGALVTGTLLLLTIGFVWAVLPTRYELSKEHLTLVFPLWRWRVALASIERAMPAVWWEAYAYWGVRFATKPGSAIVLRRRNANLFTHPHIVISPPERDDFLRRLGELGVAIGQRSVR